MAQGYARATGEVGIVLVTSGPGATNTVTPLQDALMDGTPMIVFCGQVPTTAVGSDAFQEADVVGITRSCTKWNICVKNVNEMARRVSEAFFVAQTGRPGPVLVDLPKDVTAAILKEESSSAPRLPSLTRKQDDIHASKSVLTEAARRINSSRKPIIYAGQGVISGNATHLLKQLSDQGSIPVTTTLQGLGGYDELSEKSMHMLGMHGSAYANYAMQEADCIIALGARFDDRVTGKISEFAKNARDTGKLGNGGIIHFEINRSNIDKVIPVDCAVEGDVQINLQNIMPNIEKKDRTAWLDYCSYLKREYPFKFDTLDENVPLKQQEVIAELYEQTKHMSENVIITTGVGQHQMWAAQYYRYRSPRSWISSGGLGTMGFGLPAAIGAQVACPDKIVVDIDGDGSFSMTMQELATAGQYRIPVKVLLLNNDFQGMVKQWQDLFYDSRGYQYTQMVNPNFVKLAEANNFKGLRLTSRKDLKRIIAEFLACKDPVLLDVVVDKDEYVFPMVAAGKALHEMVLPLDQTKKVRLTSPK